MPKLYLFRNLTPSRGVDPTDDFEFIGIRQSDNHGHGLESFSTFMRKSAESVDAEDGDLMVSTWNGTDFAYFEVERDDDVTSIAPVLLEDKPILPAAFRLQWGEATPQEVLDEFVRDDAAYASMVAELNHALADTIDLKRELVIVRGANEMLQDTLEEQDQQITETQGAPAHELAMAHNLIGALSTLIVNRLGGDALHDLLSALGYENPFTTTTD